MKFRDAYEGFVWHLTEGSPPPALKAARIIELCQKHAITTLIETGTYRGDMIWKLKDKFQQIWSIELDESLYKSAQRRFFQFEHVHIVHGDSGEMLEHILTNLSSPCLFWLDAHYSGGITMGRNKTIPILRELEMIRRHQIKKHVILVDDIDLFTAENGYPTLPTVIDLLRAINPEYKIVVKENILRVYITN